MTDRWRSISSSAQIVRLRSIRLRSLPMTSSPVSATTAEASSMHDPTASEGATYRGILRRHLAAPGHPAHQMNRSLCSS